MLFSIVALAASPRSATQDRPPAKCPNSILVPANSGVADPEAMARGVASIYLHDLIASVAK